MKYATCVLYVGVYHGKAQYYYFSDIIPSSPNKFNLLAILYKPSSPNLLGLDGLYNIANKFNLLGLDGIIILSLK